MPEISLHILDVTNNSVKANANLIEIYVEIRQDDDKLSVIIKDNGHGMSQDTINKVTDPFFTSRTTRNVGLGIPFFKLSAEATGGDFIIKSKKGSGTTVKATYKLSHIDRMPLGDINSTIQTLVVFNKDIDFLYEYKVDGESFRLDTKEFREILGDIPFDHPEIYVYIQKYLEENHNNINKGLIF